MVRLRGWAIAKSPVTIRIYDENKEQLAADIQRTDRVDVDSFTMRSSIRRKQDFSRR